MPVVAGETGRDLVYIISDSQRVHREIFGCWRLLCADFDFVSHFSALIDSRGRACREGEQQSRSGLRSIASSQSIRVGT